DSVKWEENSDQVIFEGAPATLYKVSAPTARPEEIKAKKILYNRKTGAFSVDGATIIQSWLAPRLEERARTRVLELARSVSPRTLEDSRAGFDVLLSRADLFAAVARLDANGQEQPLAR